MAKSDCKGTFRAEVQINFELFRGYGVPNVVKPLKRPGILLGSVSTVRSLYGPITKPNPIDATLSGLDEDHSALL